LIGGAEMAEIDLNLLSPELVAYIHALEQKIVKQQVQIQNLYEMLVNARKHTFGQSSEQSKYLSDSDQMNFFNEAEKEFNSGAAEPTEQTIRVAEHTRKEKRTKEELTESLPHYEIDCTLEGEDKICDICGAEFVCIGKEKVRSELIIIPQQMACGGLFSQQLQMRCL
jgi:transposase